MKPTGFYFYTSDWRNNPALRACSPGARSLWLDLLCLMAEAPVCGELRFGSSEYWRIGPVESWKSQLTNSRKNLAYETRKKLEKNQKITRKKLEKNQIFYFFRDLEKMLNIHRSIIARQLLELAERGVFACNDAGFIVSSKLIRQASEAGMHRIRQARYRAKSDAPVTLPVLSPQSTINSPIVPSLKRGDDFASFGKPKQKRRRATRAEIDLQVGRENGNGSLTKFRETFFASGGNPRDLEKVFHELRGDWRKIENYMRRERSANSHSLSRRVQ